MIFCGVQEHVDRAKIYLAPFLGNFTCTVLLFVKVWVKETNFIRAKTATGIVV